MHSSWKLRKVIVLITLRFNINFSQLDLVKNISWVDGVHTSRLHHDYSASLIKMLFHKFRLLSICLLKLQDLLAMCHQYTVWMWQTWPFGRQLYLLLLKILDCLQKVWLVFFLVLLANNVSFTPHWSLVVLWTQPWRFCIIVCVAVSCQWFLVAFFMELWVFCLSFLREVTNKSDVLNEIWNVTSSGWAILAFWQPISIS